MKTKRIINIPSVAYRLKCITDIESKISIPQKGFFVRNATSMRLCYSVGKQIHYIHLTTPEQAAKFLRTHGIIDSYAIAGNEIKMYGKALITIVGDKGQPVQYERMIPIEWNDINLNAAQVHTFAAFHEFEKAGKTMGKVVNMLTDFLKTA